MTEYGVAKTNPKVFLRSLNLRCLCNSSSSSSDHFSRSIILSRLGVDQSYTRNLPTSDLGGRRKTRRRGGGSKKRQRFLAYLIKDTQPLPSRQFIFQKHFRNCSELNYVQKSNILWVDGVL